MHIGIEAAFILLFVLLSVGYFAVPIMNGQVLTGHDHSAAVGSNVEMQHYRETHDGERTRWTNTLFSGMPTYQMSPSYHSTDVLSKIEKVYQLGLPEVATYLFMMLLGFYIMMRAFDFRSWMAALGAILWAFSSYYLIIIGAGHIWKLLTLSFIPPTIGGLVLCYRGKYMWGIVVTGIFTALQILSNHVQMSYYFLGVMAVMVLAYLVDAIRTRRIMPWLRATAACALGGLLGVAINASNLYHTWQYSKESMRSKSELTQTTVDASQQTSSGLERDYITHWSYGIGETWTLLIPATKGGASNQAMSENERAMTLANPDYTAIYQQIGQYWGEQPGTSGPVYVGALVCFLFLLGILVVRGPMKWGLLIATILSVWLSWGRNFMPLTDLFLDYVPMYDKFRTVSSILVIAEFTMPLLGMLALKTIMDTPDWQAQRTYGVRNLYLFLGAAAATLGICVLFWLMPDLFFGNYISSAEMQALNAGIPQEYVIDIVNNLSDMRRAVFTNDATRSLFFVAVGVTTILLYMLRKIKAPVMALILIPLCLWDLWSVDKRYMNDSMFSDPMPHEQFFAPSQADEQILQDQDPYHRVLNMSVSTFNDNSTSFYHKSIGGYHAAKLRRYQELIEHHLQPEMMAMQSVFQQYGCTLDSLSADQAYTLMPTLSMLNMKYVIVPTQSGKISVENPYACGNGWFVSHVQYVQNADEEISELGKHSPRQVAVVNQEFRDQLGEATSDSTATVQLTQYEANELHYTIQSQQGGIVVLSEIYYPGWTATVDGVDTPIGRADYVLRAIRVAPGKHEVVMKFDPQSVHTTETIAFASLGVLGLILLLSLGLTLYQATRHKP